MRILVVGNGAREDALSWRLAASPSCEAIFAAPGNAGTASRGPNWDIPVTNAKRLVDRCIEERVDLVVLGPETAIAAGVGDKLRDAGLSVFGPGRSAGRLESSKVYAKRFMERNGVPTARAAVVHSLDGARHALENWKGGGVVVKADGLAAGKGVVVTGSGSEALEVLTAWYSGKAIPGGGSDVLLEERLEGREVSVFALCDGRAMVPIAAACDYKRAGDGDVGPNTGGMGAYSPPAGFPDLFDEVRERILAPTLRGLLAENESYVGVLYCGLMMTSDGPKVIEFNVRFGDPESQVLMPRVTGDFAELLASTAEGAMDLSLAALSPQACVGVVLATTDYPRSSTPLQGLNADVSLGEGCQAFWGATKLAGGTVDAGGGRVLTVTALGEGVEEARVRAYESVRALAGRLGAAGLTFRTDIAKAVN